ncbi:hypothetical protein [Hydrogenimonas sp.]
MHNRFDSLLRRCKARKRKIFIKRTGTVLLLLLFMAGAAYLSGSGASLFGIGEKEAEPAAARQESRRAMPEPARVQTRPETRSETVNSPEKSPVPPKPEPKPKSAAPAVTKPQNRVQPPEKSGEKTAKKAPEKVVEPKKPQEQASQTALKKSEPEAKPRVLLEVKEVSGLDALLEQYRNSPRYSTALKIAEGYYGKGDFENASLWARKANLLDRDDERAWILYAESEYALGREARAKRILRLFLDYKDSVKARSLLMTWSKP